LYSDKFFDPMFVQTYFFSAHRIPCDGFRKHKRTFGLLIWLPT
jgi:hypothetical protein